MTVDIVFKLLNDELLLADDFFDKVADRDDADNLLVIEHWQMAKEAYRGRAARWLPVKRPEPYAAEVLRTVAKSHGIRLPSPVIGTAPEGATVLASLKSRPLGCGGLPIGALWRVVR